MKRQKRLQENIRNEVVLSPEISKMEYPMIPFDLVIEILVRLPVKSLLRFKCVSKLWCATIQGRSFIRTHMEHSRLVEVYKEDRNTFIHKTSIHGLVVEKSKFSDTYHIRNPSTKQIFHLPCPPDKQCDNMFIIYLPSADKYKLAYVKYDEGTESGVCRVLSPGIDLHWRSIDIPSCTKSPAGVQKRIKTKQIDDMLFLIRCGCWEIVCIEVESECITTVEIPHFLFSGWEDVMTFHWNNKFSLARVEEEKLSFWVLENFKERKWGESKQVVSLNILRKHPNSREFMRKYPNLRELWYIGIKHNCLWICADYENHIAYYVQLGSIHIHSSAPGKKIYSYYTPSLVHIQGMQSEGIHEEEDSKCFLYRFSSLA
ncbi:hypothetical protein ACH5RR_017684 [Cinchona calisaya]|uniref:F-box domain-containing protein n=1 Tax=Cinchona calisaya TaxID=153742 RepID=A0ABD2ZMI7_9GENT